MHYCDNRYWGQYMEEIGIQVGETYNTTELKRVLCALVTPNVGIVKELYTATEKKEFINDSQQKYSGEEILYVDRNKRRI